MWESSSLENPLESEVVYAWRWWSPCMETPYLFRGMQEVAYHWRVWSLKTSLVDNSDKTQTHTTILKLFCRKIYILRNKSINAKPNLSLNPSNFPKCQWKIQLPKFTTSLKEKQKKLKQQCSRKTLKFHYRKELGDEWRLKREKWQKERLKKEGEGIDGR